MIIKNNTGSIIGMHIPNAKAGSDGTRKLVSLLPGVNDVPSELWAKMQEVKVIQHLVDEEKLEAVESTKASGDIEENEKGQVSLKDLNAKDAIKLVHGTVDRALLDRWTEAEDRQTVLEAIERQLDAITLKEGEKADDDEEETDEDESA